MATADDLWGTGPSADELWEGKKPYNSPLDSVGRGMTMAPVSALIDAVVPGLQEGATVGERFKKAKAYYDAQNKRASAENPNAYMGGEILTNAMAMLALAPAGGAVAPISNTLKYAGQAAKLSPGAIAYGTAPALRMAAGVGDAMLGNQLISLARTADKDDQTRYAASQEAVWSPYNLLGVAGPAFEAMPQSAQYWRDVANRARTRVMAPDSPSAQRVLKEKIGRAHV